MYFCRAVFTFIQVGKCLTHEFLRCLYDEEVAQKEHVNHLSRGSAYVDLFKRGH